jgi:hypothetical protein
MLEYRALDGRQQQALSNARCLPSAWTVKIRNESLGPFYTAHFLKMVIKVGILSQRIISHEPSGTAACDGGGGS